MPEIKQVFKKRNLLAWGITLLIIPFGFTLREPLKTIRSFL